MLLCQLRLLVGRVAVCVAECCRQCVLQSVAERCRVLQRVAECCSDVFQSVAVWYSMLQRGVVAHADCAYWYVVLQCVLQSFAVCCNDAFQCVAVWYSLLQRGVVAHALMPIAPIGMTCCSVLQRVAVCIAGCCSRLQRRVSVCCNVIQYVATWCSSTCSHADWAYRCGVLQFWVVCFNNVLQSVAECCSVLQWHALSRRLYLSVWHVAACCSALQSVAVCDNVMFIDRMCDKTYYST